MRDGKDADYGGIFTDLLRMEKLVRLLNIFGFRRSPLLRLGVFFVCEKPDYRDDYLEFGVTHGIISWITSMALGLEFSLERTKKSIDLSLPR